jgi:multidrug efflux pump subunit AcrA (membrane-fusion protein)
MRQKMMMFHTLGEMRPPTLMRHVAWILMASLALSLVLLVAVPWVQTAYGTGRVIALNPNDRPQPINALVGGRIKQWFVEDGSVVKKGEPVVEIVDNDAKFVQRLEEQRDALSNKKAAAELALRTSEINLKRQKELFKKGLSAQREYEQAKITASLKRAALSRAQNELQKAEVRLSRQEVQTVLAPRDGTIVEIMAGDQATTIQAGDMVARFVPSNVAPAVELFVDGFDAPLVTTGRKVRLQFEGWPVVQFSGWPATAIGTFGGTVVRVDPSVSPNGRFRVIIVPDDDDVAWPDARFLRMGAQVKGWVLLETVSIGFELWRNLNNFPPEFPAARAAESAHHGGL